jgi:hypothetical protein
MEARFGRDFSTVRVHDDAVANDAAAEVDASAFTVGRHIVFGSGLLSPTTTDGRTLLAHELAHVVQGFDQPPGSGVGLHRKPRRAGATKKKGTIVTISARPHDVEGAQCFLAGESAPEPITLLTNDLEEGSYTLVRRDRNETPEFEEYVTADGARVKFSWRTPSTSIVAGDRVRVEVAGGQFDFAAFARAEYENVPDRIKRRLARPGAKALTTPAEQLNFANFAEELERRGVTDDELVLYQEQSRVMNDSRRQVDWAHVDVRSLVDEVLGDRGRLERAAEANTAAFQEFGKGVKDVPSNLLQAYRAGLDIEGLKPGVAEAFDDAGVDYNQFETQRQFLLHEFDTRLRLETFAVLQKFEGGLRLTREQLVRDKGASEKIAAIRSAVAQSGIKTLKTQKEAADREREAAGEAYARAVVTHGLAGPSMRLADLDPAREGEVDVAARRQAEKTAAYAKAKDTYLGALEAASGLPVSSWRGFDVDAFFFGASADRSARLVQGYVSARLSDVERARQELASNSDAVYKADALVQRTKSVLGVQPNSNTAKLVDDYVERRTRTPFWERLLDVLSLALIFVPGGAIVAAARLGVSVAQGISSIDNEATAETLARVGIKQEGGSALNVALNLAGPAGDIADVAKVARGAGAVLHSAEQAPKVLSGAADAAGTTEGALARHGADVTPPASAVDVPTVSAVSPPPAPTPPLSSAAIPPTPPAASAPPVSAPPTPQRMAQAEGMCEGFVCQYHPVKPPGSVEHRTITGDIPAEYRPRERPEAPKAGTGDREVDDVLDDVGEGTVRPDVLDEFDAQNARVSPNQRASADPSVDDITTRTGAAPVENEAKGIVGEARHASEHDPRLPQSSKSMPQKEIVKDRDALLGGHITLRELAEKYPEEGLAQVFFPSAKGGGRFIDHVFIDAGGYVVFRESKNVTRFTLTAKYLKQLGKDIEFLKHPKFKGLRVEWRISGEISDDALKHLKDLEQQYPRMFRFVRDTPLP